MPPIHNGCRLKQESPNALRLCYEDAGNQENYSAAAKGGRAAAVARHAFEKEHGRRVISNQSYIEQRKRLLEAGEDE